jgi:hypothetical protein
MIFSLLVFPLIFARAYRKFDAIYGDQMSEKEGNV